MREMLKKAKETKSNAYAPYSDFYVGAALKDENGRIFTGCNVENASYGATMCAERTAIFKAVSEGAKKIKEILIVNDKQMPYPCGMCRQVMAEFMDADGIIYVCHNDRMEKYTMKELLPKNFKL